MTDAQTALVANAVDATVLQRLINTAPTSNGDVDGQHSYTTVSYVAFGDALQTAKNVAADTKATQSQIDNAVAAFKLALGQEFDKNNKTTGLQTVTAGKADDSQLQADLAKANQKLQSASQYTAESVTKLRQSIIAATALYGDDAKLKDDTVTNQGAINTADTKLNDAYNSLVATSATVVSKDALEAAILTVSKTNNATNAPIELTNVDAKGNAIYPAADFKVFKAAYDKAVTVDADKNATQQQVTDAINGLNDAITALNKVTKLNGSVDLSQLLVDIASAQNAIALAGVNDTTPNRTLNGSHVYTEVSFKALTTALSNLSTKNATNQVFKSTDLTADNKVDNLNAATVTAADAALTAAIKGLTPVAFGMVDKTSLQAAVDDANKTIAKGNLDNLGHSLFTTDSFAAFQMEVANASTLLAKVGVTQSELDAEISTLKTASDHLAQADTPATTDVNALSALFNADAATKYDKAFGSGKNDDSKVVVNGADVTVTFNDGSYQAYVSAVNAAKKDLKANTDKPNSVKQATIDADYNAVITTFNALTVKTNKQLLVSAISTATSYKAADYSAAAFASLQTVIATSTAVNNDAKATQDQVNAATKALNEALVGLTGADKAASVDQKTVTTLASLTTDQLTALNTAFTAKSNQSDYTSASYSVFETAYTAMAKVVTLAETNTANTATKSDVTLAQLTKATTNLVNATNALVAIPTAAKSSVIDDAKLKDLIATASALNASDYTPSSFKPLTDALKQANTDEAAGITKKQVSADQAALETALDGLTPANKVTLQNALLKAAALCNNGIDKNVGVAIATTDNVSVYQQVTYNNDLATAKSVFNDKSATPSAIADAADNLLKDIAALAGKNIQSKADADTAKAAAQAAQDLDAAKTALVAQLNAAAGFVNNGKTPAKAVTVELKIADVETDTPKQKAVDAYNTALTTALGVDSTSTTAINAAANGLKDAISGLSTAGINVPGALQAFGTNAIDAAENALKQQLAAAKNIKSDGTKAVIIAVDANPNANSASEQLVDDYNRALTDALGDITDKSADEINQLATTLQTQIANLGTKTHNGN